ncbi:MAG: hypothetical protein JXR78_03020 [Victivallales bacterium]|nr:hypothetical protein [Victivallales bacterium]
MLNRLLFFAGIFPVMMFIYACSALDSHSAGAAENIRLAALFQNGMVLQRNKEIPVWGWCEPGARVKVGFLAQTVSAVAGKDGRWEAVLAPVPACGPVKMTVSGQNTIVIDNVMVGEVWLCAGSSDMSRKLSACDDAEDDIRRANNSRIRLFLTDGSGGGEWISLAHKNAGNFPAIAFYFAQDIYKYTTGVALGIILAAGESPGIKNWLPGSEVWNTLLKPLAPGAMKGMIWYHGGDIAGCNDNFKRLQINMIESWRRAWRDDALAFVTVQFPNYGQQWPVPQDSQLAKLRESQIAATQLPNVGCVVAIDLGGDKKTLRLDNERETGRRMALQAASVAYDMKMLYGRTLVPGGPVFDSMRIQDGAIFVKFNNALHGLVSHDGKELRHFAIAGKDGRYHWAKAEISGQDEVKVWNILVEEPVNVRYAWADNPLDCNLFNRNGFPAAPFRTDKD